MMVPPRALASTKYSYYLKGVAYNALRLIQPRIERILILCFRPEFNDELSLISRRVANLDYNYIRCRMC